MASQDRALLSGANRRTFLGRVMAMLGASLPACRRAASPINVLLIVADDLGSDALSCYGGPIDTPHLERICASGLRFQTCWSTPLCMPSRVQLLSGRYPFRTGWADNESLEGERVEDHRFVDPAIGTFAQVLRGAGYATAVAGKWQLCHFEQRPDHPRELGFDRACCWMWKIGTRITNRYWDPAIYRDGKVKPCVKGGYAPDLYVDYLIQFMSEARDRPFLAFLPTSLPHPHYLPTPAQMAAEPGRDRFKDDPANFPAMVRYLDGQVGRMLDAVDRLGLAERTLVLFTADNGTPAIIRRRLWPDEPDSGKGTLGAAGIHVPLLARWPGTIAPGVVSDALVDLSDFHATLAELAGAAPGAEPDIDGRSFLPVLRGGAGAREWIFSQLGDQRSIRNADFVLAEDGQLYGAADPTASIDRSHDPAGVVAKARLRAILAGLQP